jgi:hypothetical protein
MGKKRKLQRKKRDEFEKTCTTAFMRGTPQKHSLFSVVDIRSDKGKHKNWLEIVSRATIRTAEDDK